MTETTPKKRLILVRHGLTDHNSAGIMQGHRDTLLTELGHKQAQNVSHYLAELHPLGIYSSDLTRAHHTARYLAELTGLPVQIDPRIRETDLGQWSGLSHNEVDSTWPGYRLRWREDPHVTPPGGESKIALAHRGLEAIGAIEQSHPEWNSSDRPIVVFSHGGWIAATTSALLGLPVENWAMFDGLANTGMVILTHTPGGIWRLAAWNATVCHSTADATITIDSAIE